MHVSRKTIYLCIFITYYWTNWLVQDILTQACDNYYDVVVGFAQKDFALSGYQFWSARMSDAKECARACIRRKSCKSFNFNVKTGLCELNNEVWSEGLPYKTVIGSLYSVLEHWPSQIDPDCYDRPCQEDEVCIPGGLAGRTGCSYTCFRLYKRCPLPMGVKSNQPRTAGSPHYRTCDTGWVDGAPAVCQPDLTWDKDPIGDSTSCILLYGSDCTEDNHCKDINGVCLNDQCVCPTHYQYNTTGLLCEKECTSEWLRFEQKCYYFGTQNLSYEGAVELCTENGAHLVQVDTMEELTFLTNTMKEKENDIAMKHGYWCDLFEVSPGVYRWRTTNDPVDTTLIQWGSGQPNDHAGKQSCTQFKSNLAFKLDDYECEDDPALEHRPGLVLCEK